MENDDIFTDAAHSMQIVQLIMKAGHTQLPPNEEILTILHGHPGLTGWMKERQKAIYFRGQLETFLERKLRRRKAA